MNLYYDKAPCASIAEAVPRYGRGEFQSPTRSTVPLLSWLIHERPLLPSLLRDLGMPADSALHLEYTVKPQKGHGMASHTDVMALSGPSSLAIEAKWTEPRYDTVAKWLAKGKNPCNQREVLAGWLGLLQEHAEAPLHIDALSAAVYQMVHRAASACAAGDHPRMAYVCFAPPPSPQAKPRPATLHADLVHLWGLLGSPAGFPFFLVEIPLRPTEAFEQIAHLPKGKEATAPLVSAALCADEPLFEFGSYRLTTMGEEP